MVSLQQLWLSFPISATNMNFTASIIIKHVYLTKKHRSHDEHTDRQRKTALDCICIKDDSQTLTATAITNLSATSHISSCRCRSHPFFFSLSFPFTITFNFVLHFPHIHFSSSSSSSLLPTFNTLTLEKQHDKERVHLQENMPSICKPTALSSSL